MKSLFTLSLILTLGACKSQSIEEQINRDVWYPFMDAYMAQDAEAFMDVHTDDVIRVNRDGKSIKIGEEYAKSMRESAERNKTRQARRSIDFSFLERIHTEDYAYEIGYYRVRSASGGQEHVSYGKFHVVLRKVDTKWKILVDSDTSRDGSIGEADFFSGEVLDRR